MGTYFVREREGERVEPNLYILKENNKNFN